MTWTRRLYRRPRRSAGRRPPASSVVSVWVWFIIESCFVLQPPGFQTHEQGCRGGPKEAEEAGEGGEGVQEKV